MCQKNSIFEFVRILNSFTIVREIIEKNMNKKKVFAQKLKNYFLEKFKYFVRFILKKISDFEKTIEEDLKFAKRTEDALKRIDEGRGTEKDFDEFINDMKNW